MEEFLNIIYEWLFGNPYGVTMAVIDPIVGGALIGGAVQLIGGLFGGGSARRARRRAEREKRRLEGKLDSLEKSRQAIINPYAGVSDVSSMAKDLSNMVSNPYANLGVATQAAEIQIEQADIALANTLDTLRATGASAGGATALAQAALQSKKGVAANIEQQEAQNEKLKAQGEDSLQRLKMDEARRLQGIELSEAQRLQQADVAGKQFVFGQREAREMQQLDRVSAQISGAQRQAMAARANQSAITSSMLTGLGGIASAYAGNALGGTKPPTSDFSFGTPGFSDSIYKPSIPSYNLGLSGGITGPSIGGNASGFNISNYTVD
tara:strand:+ start:137 stop:1105 length:969 start_codon:yes stop_codon:yes gene_type:complete